VGEIKLFPSESIITVEHPALDSRVRTLNAGRFLYGGHSHGTGLIVITEMGASKYAVKDMGTSPFNVVWDIEEVGSNIYFLANNGIYKTTGQYPAGGFLESSEIGGNTPLIDKVWTSLTIEAKLETEHTVRVSVAMAETMSDQWIGLGEMRQADGLQKEFNIPNNVISQWMKVRLELMTSNPFTTPVLKKMMVKYVPNALQKWQWSMAIRATNGLKMLDEQKELRTGTEIISDLKDLKSIGKFQFRDIDEEVYEVILTDIKFTKPLIDKRNDESIVSMELLEA
jgi:hypothetical protein